MQNNNLEARTYLNIYNDENRIEIAKSHGAKFDGKREKWYLEGLVPPELNDVVLTPAKIKPPPVVAPTCPLCGWHMLKIEGKNGLFYGCSQFRNRTCLGSIDYDEYVEKIGRQTVLQVGRILNLQPSTQSAQVEHPSHISVDKVSSELVAKNDEIKELCKKNFSTKAEMEKWMNTPKVALSLRTPLEALTKLDGCKIVAELLETLFD